MKTEKQKNKITSIALGILVFALLMILDLVVVPFVADFSFTASNKIGITTWILASIAFGGLTFILHQENYNNKN